jgi:hypothetical protein
MAPDMDFSLQISEYNRNNNNIFDIDNVVTSQFTTQPGDGNLIIDFLGTWNLVTSNNNNNNNNPFRMEDLINSIEAEILNESFENTPTKSIIKSVSQDIINSILGSYKKYNETMSCSDSCCSICLEHYQANKYIRNLPCNHTYHKVCIDKWFKEGSFSCPTCRMDFNEDKVDTYK